MIDGLMNIVRHRPSACSVGRRMHQAMQIYVVEGFNLAAAGAPA